MRQLIGVGTPRGLQGRLIALVSLLKLIGETWQMVMSFHPSLSFSQYSGASIARAAIVSVGALKTGFTTGRWRTGNGSTRNREPEPGTGNGDSKEKARARRAFADYLAPQLFTARAANSGHPHAS